MDGAAFTTMTVASALRASASLKHTILSGLESKPTFTGSRLPPYSICQNFSFQMANYIASGKREWIQRTPKWSKQIILIVIFGISHFTIFQKETLGFTHHYSSVPNRRVGQNKHAGGKILKKTLNVQNKIRPCRREFFLKINKRAGQNKTAVQEKIGVQGGKCSQNQ